MQVPAGPSSIFDALEKREINARDAAVYLVINAYSNWSTGLSHKISHRKLAKIFGWDSSYPAKIVPRIIKAGFAKRVSKPHLTSIYQLTHHNCHEEDVPLDKDERPLKFAAASGKKSPLAKLVKGKISWQAFLVWMVMHKELDWGTQTGQIGHIRLQKTIGLGHKAICEAIRELGKVGLLKQLPDIPHENRAYQLFPMKMPDTKRRRKAEPYKGSPKTQKMQFDQEGWAVSHNGLYRMHRFDARIERRWDRKDTWKPLRDQLRHEIPAAIQNDFDALVQKEASGKLDIKSMIAGVKETAARAQIRNAYHK